MGDRQQTPLDDAIANGNGRVAAVFQGYGGKVSKARD